MKQRALDLRTWGGARAGAGRKRAGTRPRAPHLSRGRVPASRPVHVTLRVAAHVWNLRSERSFAVIHGALDAVRERPGFRVAHFSIPGDHLHLLVEVAGAGSLSTGMRALTTRLARGLDRMMGRSGPVFEDRYHAHVLRTPVEARNALRYVLENRASHRERLGLAAARSRPDPYSSAVPRAPLCGQLEPWRQGAVRPSRTWLLRSADGSAGR